MPGVDGTFVHTLWECAEIQIYWGRIVGEINNILEIQLEMEPKYLLLGISTEVDIPQQKLLLANLGLVVAKRDIARYWGVPQIPTLHEWRKCLDLYMVAERVTYKARGCPQKFKKIWAPWMKYYGLELDGEIEEVGTPGRETGEDLS